MSNYPRFWRLHTLFLQNHKRPLSAGTADSNASPASQHQAPYRSLAAQARKPRTLVDAMLQLEEPRAPRRPRNRSPKSRPAVCVSENSPKASRSPSNSARLAALPAAVADAGAKQALVGVNVAHP